MARNQRSTAERLPLLLTVEAVASELGINRATVYSKLIRSGVLRTVVIGRSRRVALRDLEAYIERLRSGAIAFEGGSQTGED